MLNKDERYAAEVYKQLHAAWLMRSDRPRPAQGPTTRSNGAQSSVFDIEIRKRRSGVWSKAVVTVPLDDAIKLQALPKPLWQCESSMPHGMHHILNPVTIYQAM